MITLKPTVVAKRAIKKISKAAKQAEYANVVALTRTAWKVKGAEEAALDKYLDSPTPFTKKAFRVKKATKASPHSMVYAAPIQNEYLRHIVYGGTVAKKVPVPPDAAKNKYGNLPRRATKGKRVYHVNNGGKEYTFRRTSKRKSKLLGTWTKTRSYSKRLPFKMVASQTVDRHYKALFKSAFKQAMASAR